MGLGGIVVLLFVCDYQRDQRETLGCRLCNRLSTLAYYSLADSADHAERMQQAALYRRERQLVVVVWLLGLLLFWVLSA